MYKNFFFNYKGRMLIVGFLKMVGILIVNFNKDFWVCYVFGGLGFLLLLEFNIYILNW